MMGFLPGLPYLGGLPPEFALPRRENPRLKVPAGSISVAMAMTVIYPLESPGGWHILARTPAPLWDMRRPMPALFDAGDVVTFAPVSLSEYEAMLAKAAAGELRVEPEPQPTPRPSA
jgi:KipI family sensor histidine kinase inhibitor